VQIGVSTSAARFAVFGGVSMTVGDVLGSHGPEERQRQARARAAAGRK
jgi:hypothetical protein